MRCAALAFLLLAGCTTMATPPPTRTSASAGVAFDRNAELGSFAEGLADPASGRELTVDDPARVASVSKLVTTIGVMKLVEEGKLDLEVDASIFLGWLIKDPHFPDSTITLGMLLSHTSGLREHDDNYVIPLGGTVRAALEDPTNWDREHAPGEWFHYTNMNFPVVASIVEKVTGERFDRWMRREVLEPMKIDACYNWPTCSDAAVARAVVLTREGKSVKDDLGGKQPDCPVAVPDGAKCDLSTWKPGENGALFSPQGGLRISARGLARIGRMLLNGGTLDGVRILSPESVERMAQPVFEARWGKGDPDSFYCIYGLATHTLASGVAGCRDDPADDGVHRRGHAGEAYGLRSGLWIDPASGTGMAYFITDQPDSVPGNASMTEAEAATFRRALALTHR